MNKKFQREPNSMKDDYAFIRTATNWNGGPINIFTPFIVLIDCSGHRVIATDVIGNSSASLRVVLPQTILYYTLREMKAHDNMAAQTQAYELSYQPTICANTTEPTSLSDWHHVLVGLHYSDKVELRDESQGSMKSTLYFLNQER